MSPAAWLRPANSPPSQPGIRISLALRRAHQAGLHSKRDSGPRMRGWHSPRFGLLQFSELRSQVAAQSPVWRMETPHAQSAWLSGCAHLGHDHGSGLLGRAENRVLKDFLPCPRAVELSTIPRDTARERGAIGPSEGHASVLLEPNRHASPTPQCAQLRDLYLAPSPVINQCGCASVISRKRRMNGPGMAAPPSYECHVRKGRPNSFARIGPPCSP